MAIAIRDRLNLRFPDLQIVVPGQFGTTQEIERHGFLKTWESSSRRRRKLLTATRKFLPNGLSEQIYRGDRFLQKWMSGPQERRSRRNIVDPSQIDAVLDASGFAFGDQWGPARARALYEKMEQTERRGKPLILLPQALGPFNNASTAKWCKKLFERASTCFARDKVSCDFTNQLLHGSEKVMQFPDFTALIESVEPENYPISEPFCAIVPNMRMIDKGGDKDGYVSFLSFVWTKLEEQGERVVFILHDANDDRHVVAMLEKQIKKKPVVWHHNDPRVLKAVLGKARFVIGSRFHALVSALSQGTPCIGVGWSHKYPELLADYGCADLLVKDVNDLHRAKLTINKLLSRENRYEYRARIEQHSQIIKKLIEQMWQETFRALPLVVPATEQGFKSNEK